MSKLCFTAVLMLATPALAQQVGVSHPDETVIETSAVPADSADKLRNDGPAPLSASPTAEGLAGATQPGSASSPAVTLQRHDLAKFAPSADPDAGIVGDDLVQNPDQVAAGTLIRARLRSSIHTGVTQPGTPFLAEVSEPLLHDGRVIVPAGAVLEGHITEVRGGRRLHGPALIHLQAQSVLLPDGSRIPVHASVIDTDQFAETKIDEEGNIVRRDHAKQTLATFTLATGGAAAAGGVLAGVPGALIGAGVGAGVSTIMWLKADRQTQLPANTLLVLALDSPFAIQPLVREPDYSLRPATPTQAPVPAAPAAPEPQAFVPTS